MRLFIIIKVTGFILRGFGLMLLWPLAVAAYYEEWADLGGYALAGVLAAATGQAMWHAGRERKTSGEGTIGSFDTMVILLLDFLFEGPLPAKGERVAGYLDLDVVR